MRRDSTILDSREGGSKPHGLGLLSSHWQDYNLPEPTDERMPDLGGPVLMIETEPNHWCFLGPEDPGCLHLWQGMRESLIKPKLAAAVEQMKSQLARGVFTVIRIREITRAGGVDFIRRGFEFSPIVGPGRYIEWINETPIVYDRDYTWPKTPAAREPVELQRAA